MSETTSYKLSATLELKDKFTSTIKSTQDSMKKFEGATKRTADKMREFSQRGGSAFTDFASKVKSKVTEISGNILPKLKTGVTNALNGMKGAFKKGLGGMKSIFGTFFNSFTGGLLGMQAISAAGGFAKNTLVSSFQLYAELQDKLARNMSLMGLDTEKFKEMKQQVEELGAATEYSAAQVADVHKYLAMAGWNAESIKVATANILEFASATGTDLAESANIAASYLNAFEMKAEELPRLLDVMSTVALKSATNINEISEAFRGMAGVNKGRDTIEELGIVTGLLANLGTTGSRAGEFYKSAISRLSGGGTEVEKARKALGINFYKILEIDKDGKKIRKKVNKSTLEIFSDISKNIQKFDVAKQNEIYNALFGIGHIANARKLINAMASDEYPRLIKEMENASGTTKEMYKTWTENSPQFKIAELSSAWEGLRLKLGEAMAPTVLKYMDILKDKLSEWTESGKIEVFVQKTINFIGQIKEVGATVLDVLKPIGSVLMWYIGLVKKYIQGVIKLIKFVKQEVIDTKNKYLNPVKSSAVEMQTNIFKEMREKHPETYMLQMKQQLENGDFYKRYQDKNGEFQKSAADEELAIYKEMLKKEDPDAYQNLQKQLALDERIAKDNLIKLPTENLMTPPIYQQTSGIQPQININPVITVNGQDLQETKEQLNQGLAQISNQIIEALTGSIQNAQLVN